MKRPKNKYALFVIGFVLVVASGFLYYFLDTTSTEVAGLRKKLFNLRQESQEMETLQRRYDDLKSEIDTISQSLPETTIDIASFLQAVNAAANTNGVTITSDIENQQDEEDIPEGLVVKVRIAVSGSFVATTQFINTVSNLPFYFDVIGVNMLPNTTGSGIETTFRIGLVTSYHET